MTKNEILASGAACLDDTNDYCEGCKYNELDVLTCRKVLLDELRESMKTDEIELSVPDKDDWFIDSEEVKQTDGKLRLDLIPPGTDESIAEVRGWAAQKYPDPDSWKRVRPKKIIAATKRHFNNFEKYYYWRDAESGLYHLQHALTNMTFLNWQLLMGLLDEKHDERFPRDKENNT